jgi:hypothetical protein
MPKRDIEKDMEVADIKEQQAKSMRDTIVQQQEARKAAEAPPPENDNMVTLPGGKRWRVSDLPFMEHKYASVSRIEEQFLADPSKFIKDPDPNYEYWLPDGEDYQKLTQSRIKAKIYIPVTMDEMRDDIASPTHEGTDDFVHWNRHILVKVRKDYADAQHRAPEQAGIAALAGESQRFQGEVESATRGVGKGIHEKKTK